MRSSVVASPDSLTVTLSRGEFVLLLDDIAYLEADLADCEERLVWATETPPECSDGGTVKKLLIGALVGGLAVALVK